MYFLAHLTILTLYFVFFSTIHHFNFYSLYFLAQFTIFTLNLIFLAQFHILTLYLIFLAQFNILTLYFVFLSTIHQFNSILCIFNTIHHFNSIPCTIHQFNFILGILFSFFTIIDPITYIKTDWSIRNQFISNLLDMYFAYTNFWRIYFFFKLYYIGNNPLITLLELEPNCTLDRI